MGNSSTGTALVVIMAALTPVTSLPEGPCPPRHHHRLSLSSATWLAWLKTARQARQTCGRDAVRWGDRQDRGRLAAASSL